MIAALTDLMEQAKAYAQDKGITKFDAALNDLDEFVAYGMTRKSFQEFLAQVTVTTPSTGLVNGFKEFVDRLVGLLFARIKKTQTQEAQASTALAGLIENVTGLLESATVEQAGVRDSTGLPAKSMTRDTRVLTISEDREGFKLVDTTTGEWIEVGHPLEDEITGLIRTRKDAEVVLRAWDSRTIRSLSMAMPANPVGAVNNFTTLDIHNALNAGSVTPEFDAKLRNVLGGIVEKLYGPFQVLKPGWMKNQALTAVDVWHKALATGNAPFAGSAIAAPFIMSEREAHAMEQVEATVRIALERDETTATSARHELNTLFTEAMSIIKPTDFASVDQYNFLFKVETGANGRSDHLARFAAFGLANEQVNKLLRVNTQGTAKKQGKTIMEKLGIFWEGVLEFFHEKVTSTYAGQKADAKLLRLVDQLIDIEAKKRSSLARRAGAFNLTAPIEAGAKKLVEAGIRKVSDIAGSQLVRNNSSSVVKAVGSVVRIVANNQVDAFMEEVKQFRAQQWKDRLGFVAGTLNYAMGGDKVQEALLRERKVLEGERKDLITRISKMTRQAFVNGGKDMSKAAKNSITQVFMRTGAFVLKGPYNMTQLENLVGDKAARNAEIASLEAQLTGLGNMRNSVINQAKALGYFKVTGRNKAKVLMMNAHNIARLYGTPYRNRVTEAQAQQREPVVEKLVALYALSYVPPAELNIAKRVLQTENARPASEGNGVEFVLEMHRRMDKESRDRLFQGQEALMTHGYTQEIYSPHIEIQTADDVTGQELINKGYKKGAAVEIDPAHPDQTRKHLYVLDGGGLMPHLTGNLAYDGKRSKGARQHSGYMNINTADGLANASLQADIMHGKQNAMNNASNWDPSQEKHTYMAPIVNPQGEIVNWRYLMHDSTKDTILQRENQFDLVLGTLAGSIFGKDTVTDTNTRVFQAMKDQYDAEKARKSAAYVLVGPKSPDPELREMWAKLPDDSKAAARAIWGRDGMFVRNDQRDIIFGYRKLSLANAIRSTQDRRKDDADRIARGMAPIGSQGLVDDFENAMAKFFTVAVEHALVLHARTKGHPDPEKYGERAAVVISRGERAWQEIVGETKDLLVIKTVTVMMGNLKSNMSLLILSGVPIKDIVNSHLVAWRGATSYQRDSDELDRLKTLIDIGQTNGKDAQIKIQIARLEDALARNPVRELIEAGLMPTIVEDAAEDVDPYSYKSALTEKVDTLTSKLHPGVKTTLKNVYMTKDTAPYQALRRVTQLSDFMARYTQYQHLTTRQVDPLSKEDAIQQSSEDFINYDVPMHRSMQYLDDMGIFPFMKYFLRVQKVLMRLTKDHPARVFSAVLLGQFLDFGPIVLDSSWVAKIGNNPIHWGALQYPGALDELATVNSALSLVGAGGSDWAPQ
jgi:predicted regulator of Ras-like GTPase activity (Roadblock/LC7/MglB family)